MTPSDLVAQRDGAAVVGLDLCEVERDVVVELLEKPDAVRDQDWQD